MNQRNAIPVSAIIVALAALMAVPTTAQADEHPPYYRVYRRKVIIVRPPPPPPQRVVVVQPEPAPRRHVQREQSLLGIGLRVSGTGLEGSKLGLEDMENPAMAGIGLQLRSKVSRHWGLELSADYLGASDSSRGFSQRTIPVMLSAMFFSFPDSPINPYALAGGGVHFTMLEYMDGAFQHHILEVAGQLGLGVQVKLGRHFALHADLRFLTVYKNLGTTTEVSQGCLSSDAAGTGYCNGLANLDPNDKFNIGAQFQAGATYFF